MFHYAIYKILQIFINTSSRQTSYKVASLLADIQYFISKKDRENVRKNLRHIYQTSHSLNKETKDVFRNFGKYLVDFLWMDKHLNQQFISEKIKFEGLGNLERAYQEEKGVLLLTAHIGSWELGAAILSQIGYPISAIALEHANERIDALFNQQRLKQGVEIVPVHEASRLSLKALNKCRCLAIACERDFTGHGLKMPFLGKEVKIPKGPALFSAKTGAPIIPTFLIRQPDDTFCFKIFPAINFEKKDVKMLSNEKLREMIQPYIKVIEEEIRKEPSQWLMFREY